MDESGLYHHRGRIDDMVKINGMLVEPREAEQALRAIPGVGPAAVLPHRTPSGKTRLVAHLRVDDPALTPESVRAQLEARLPRHLVPSLLMRHDDLPFNERNKLDRTGLRSMELVRWRSRPRREPVLESEIWLVGQVAQLLDLGDVGLDDDLWQLGLDSLGAVELCTIVSDAGFGDLDPRALLEHRTAGDLSWWLLGRGRPDRSPVTVLNGDGQRPALFAIPGGGGTSLAFRSLAQELGADQPLLVLEPIGLHAPGRPDRTIVAQADRARAEIDARLGPVAPCVLLGYSAGSTVAYEIAQQLRTAGRQVHLVLLDAAPGRNPGPRRARQADEVGPGEPPLRQKLRDHSPLALVAALPGIAVRRTRRLGRHAARRLRLRFPNAPLGRPIYDLQHYREFRRILSRATDRYELRPATFPVTLVDVQGSTAAVRCAPTTPHLDVHRVSGDHYTMLQPPNVAGLAEVVRSVIASTDVAAASR
jgi:thioesterase domain-containing protein